jgi:hypothetical protein
MTPAAFTTRDFSDIATSRNFRPAAAGKYWVFLEKIVKFS